MTGMRPLGVGCGVFSFLIHCTWQIGSQLFSAALLCFLVGFFLVMKFTKQLQISRIGFILIKALPLARTCHMMPVTAWRDAVKF